MCEHQEKPLADWVRDGAPIWSNSRLMTTKEAAGAGPTGSRGQLKPEGRGLRGNGENSVPVPPALHGDESGLSAVCLGWQAGLCAPSGTVTGSAARKGGVPLKKSPMGGQGPSSRWVCSSVEKPVWLGLPREDTAPSPLPDRACCCHSMRPHLPQPHSPRARVPLPPAWTPHSGLEPTEACGHLCLWHPVRGQVPPSRSKPGLFLLCPMVGKGAAARARSRSPGPGPHPPACGLRGLVSWASRLQCPDAGLVQEEWGLELPASQVHLQTLERSQVSTSWPQEGSQGPNSAWS